MLDDLIDGLDKDLESHRERERDRINDPIIKPTTTAKPSGKFDIDELDFGVEKSMREETGLNHSKWADEEEAENKAITGMNQDEAFDFE